MSSEWRKYIMPTIFTALFAFFFIPLYLILICFSRFLRSELKRLSDEYGWHNVLETCFQSNIGGLFNLFKHSRRNKI